jgi:hypothetical protein
MTNRSVPEKKDRRGRENVGILPNSVLGAADRRAETGAVEKTIPGYKHTPKPAQCFRFVRWTILEGGAIMKAVYLTLFVRLTSAITLVSGNDENEGNRYSGFQDHIPANAITVGAGGKYLTVASNDTSR